MENKILCGDNVKVLKTFPNACIDLVVTSPPYDSLRTYNGYTLDIEGLINELYRVIKNGGVVVWVVGDESLDGSESGTSFKHALMFHERGFNIHDTMIYMKKGFRTPSNIHRKYHQVFEYMFVFSKGRPNTFNPIKDRENTLGSQGEKKYTDGLREKDGSFKHTNRNITIERYGMRYNVWSYSTGFMKSAEDLIAFDHPAIFPEELAEDHILSWSNKGDVVLDPFSGSGTTCKMAYVNDRKYIGIDISAEYNQIAEERIRKSSPKCHQDNNPKTIHSKKLSRYE